MTFNLKKEYVSKEDFFNLYGHYNLDKDSQEKYTIGKWIHAAIFCNDLSIKQGLTPCYEYEGHYVSACNYEDTGIDVKCNYSNNGWRLPDLKEINVYLIEENKKNYATNIYEWCNDIGNSKNERYAIKQIYVTNKTLVCSEAFEAGYRFPFRIGRNITL